MGFGLPGALGAAFAEPDKQVVHICGDGGFKMTGMELYTAAREGKKIISIVINNSSREQSGDRLPAGCGPLLHPRP